jgi:hypothetical protein
LVTAFSLVFFHELRERICGKEATKIGEVGGVTARGLATGVSAWLMGAFGLTNPIALGVAATILFVLSGATKGAFCKATEPEVRDALRSSTALAAMLYAKQPGQQQAQQQQ